MSIVMPEGRKHLSADALFRLVHKGFASLPDYRVGDVEITLPDALMSAFAMFSLKAPSILAPEVALGDARLLAHSAQGGLYVRPANGWDSLERLRLGLMGSASAGPNGVQHHTYPQQPQHYELIVKRCGIMAVPPHYGMIWGYVTGSSGWGNYPQATGTQPLSYSLHIELTAVRLS